MEKFANYLLSQLDKVTAWIGFIGLTLMFLGLYSALMLLFVLLIVLPETQFSDIFKNWTKSIRGQAK